MLNRTGFAYTRALSRQFFPTWSRRARARWVLARMKARNPRVPISSSWSHDSRAYWFQRTSRAAGKKRAPEGAPGGLGRP